MAATGVRPKSAEMVLCLCPALQQHLSLVIEYKDGEGSVESAPILVRSQLRLEPDGVIVFINEDYLFAKFVLSHPLQRITKGLANRYGERSDPPVPEMLAPERGMRSARNAC